MRRFGRLALALTTALSALLLIAITALWLRTEAMQRTDSLVWGEAGVYHVIEFSEDDADYKILHDPGLPPTPLKLHVRNNGWLRPPAPSRRGVLPRGATSWLLPSPAHLANGKFEWSDAL